MVGNNKTFFLPEGDEVHSENIFKMMNNKSQDSYQIEYSVQSNNKSECKQYNTKTGKLFSTCIFVDGRLVNGIDFSEDGLSVTMIPTDKTNIDFSKMNNRFYWLKQKLESDINK